MDGLWQHQRDAVEWSAGRKAVLLHHEPGCGKTRTTLEILRRLMEEAAGDERFLTLVCCPKAVIPAWSKQVGLWMPELRVVSLTKGTSRDKAKCLLATLSDKTPTLVVVNYESGWRIPEIDKVSWSAVVWDEVHKLKSPSGSASRWAGRLCKSLPEATKIGLSGTLIPHSILDAYGVYRSVEAPECPTFGQSYTKHKWKYAVVAPGQNFVIGFRNLEEAHRKIASTTHHVKSADVLDLPPIRFIDTPCELSPQEAKIYREIEREFCAVAETGTVTPKNALEQLLRMQQSCGGAVRYDGESVARPIVERGGKADVLAESIDGFAATERLVIFCRFTSDITAARAVCEAAGRSVSELSGRVNELSAWQQGDTTVLLAQIQAGGIGVDMSTASSAFFFSLGFSLSDYIQAVARLHRPGQSRPTTIWHLIATIDGRQTVDGRVYEALRDRKEVLDAIIDGYGKRGATPVGAV